MNVNESTLSMTTLDVVMRSKSIYKIPKRTVDILVGIAGTVILAPLCVAVKFMNLMANDTDPMFFVQERIGQDGKKFKMYKFRTMVVGADEKLQTMLRENEDLKKEYEENKKLKNDPRITKMAAFLRKTSLDEFPQFINILKGEMSVVGPRPYLEREKKDMGRAYKTITTMKPGLTGLWQVSGRSELSFDERLKLDVKYYQTNSFKGDMKILFKTIKTVLCKKGAV